MFENRALRRMFGSKRVEVTGGWGKLNNAEVHNLHEYSSPNIARMIMSRRIKGPGHIARMRRIGTHIGNWCESQKVREH
jgi:hypothetical protein